MNYDQMPFGKHRFSMLDDVPESYFEWVLREISDLEDRHPGLTSAIRDSLRRRRNKGQSSFDEDGNYDSSGSSSRTYGNSGSGKGSSSSGSGGGYDDFFGKGRSNGSSGYSGYSGGSSSYTGRVPSTVDQETAIKIIEAGRRMLALKNHPDAGGTNDVMSKINTTTDWLFEHIKATIPAGTRR